MKSSTLKAWGLVPCSTCDGNIRIIIEVVHECRHMGITSLNQHVPAEKADGFLQELKALMERHGMNDNASSRVVRDLVTNPEERPQLFRH